jgi:hypothetical protein
MRMLLATTLSVAIATTGGVSPEVYLKDFPTGTKIRVVLTDRSVIRGTLRRVTPDTLSVETKAGKPPLDVPFRDISRITADKGRWWTPWAIGKTIGYGVRSGVSAIVEPFVILIVLMAVWDE